MAFEALAELGHFLFGARDVLAERGELALDRSRSVSMWRCSRSLRSRK